MRTKHQREQQAYALHFGVESDAVRSSPCIFEGLRDHVCNYAQRMVDDMWERYSDPAHVRSRGAGGTRFELVPMCRKAHTVQGNVGIETLAKLYGLDLWQLADEIALLGHERPLGLRGLADLWRERRGVGYVGIMTISSYEREALGRFVRREMGRWPWRPWRPTDAAEDLHGAREVGRGELGAHMREVLGGEWMSEEALDLCEWAGWP